MCVCVCPLARPLARAHVCRYRPPQCAASLIYLQTDSSAVSSPHTSDSFSPRPLPVSLSLTLAANAFIILVLLLSPPSYPSNHFVTPPSFLSVPLSACALRRAYNFLNLTQVERFQIEYILCLCRSLRSQREGSVGGETERRVRGKPFKVNRSHVAAEQLRVMPGRKCEFCPKSHRLIEHQLRSL